MSDAGEDQHIWRTSVSKWPQAIRDLCLPVSEFDAGPADTALMILLSAGERGEARAHRLSFSDEFRSDLDTVLSQYPDGAHLRLNLCSFKRGPRAPRIRDAAGFEAVLARQNYRVYSVLKATVDRKEDVQLFAFPWRDIPHWSGFRIFIRDRRVIGISQYHHQSGFPEISASERAIKASLSDFCRDLLDALHMDTVVADVYVECQEDDRFRTTLIELNPFIQRTDPCLYSWKNGGDFDGGFRYREAQDWPQAVRTGTKQLVGHPHTCPIHGGGPVMNPGQSFVRFNGIPLAVEGGQCGCPGSPPLPDPMVKGSGMVKINGRGVMRVGDTTAHGGRIAMGVPTLKSD